MTIGGKGGGTNTVQTNSAPPPEVMAQYQQLIAQANQAAAAPLQQYSGNVVAPFNATQQQAFNEVQGAQGASQPYFNQAQGLIQNASQPITAAPITASTINQYTNPYTQDVINSTLANINQQNQGQQSQLMGNAVAQGAWGGDRSAVAQALLANQQDLAKNQTIAGLESQGYSQALGEANTQQQAQLGAQEASQYLGQQGGAGLMSLGNAAQTSALAGASALTQTGGLQQQLQQEQLNVPYEQFLQQQAYPFQNIGWLSGISTGLGSGSGYTNSTTSPSGSTAAQLAGLGVGGLSLYGAVNGAGGIGGSTGAGMARGGHVEGLIKRLKSGGAVMMPPHYDVGGGIIPGQVTVQEMENAGIPDLTQSPFGTTPAMTKGMGVPMMKPSGSTSKTTGDNQGQPSVAGLVGDWNAGKGLAKIYNGLSSSAAPDISIDTSPSAMAATFPGGAGNASGMFDMAANPGTSNVLSTDMASSLGGSPSLSGFFGMNGSTAAADAGLTDAGASAATDTAATDVAASSPAWLSAISSAADAAWAAIPTMAEIAAFFAARGGAVPSYAQGGLIKRYDDGGSVSGGLTPFDTSTNPMANAKTSQFANMSPEQLAQLATRLPPTTPQGQLVQKVLNQKRMMPSTGVGAPAPNLPFAQLAPQQAARGGLIKHYDDGGATDMDNSTPVPDTLPNIQSATAIPDAMPSTQPMMSPDNAAKMVDLYSDAAPTGLVKNTVAPIQSNDNGFTPIAVPEFHDAQPTNQPNPWLALAQAGFGMAASKSPHALQALAEGAQEGLQNYGGQLKEAADETYKSGQIQDARDKLVREAEQFNATGQAHAKEYQQNLALDQQKADQMAKHQQGELDIKGQELQQTIANNLAERQKPIPDGFGGFIIPNPKDPANPIQVGMGGSGSGGGDASKPSLANVWSPPVDADGKPLTGEAYYATVPPMVSGLAREIQSGNKAPPTGFASKPVLLAAERAAANADPSYVGTRFSTLQDFTKGPQTAKTIQSQNAVMEHIPVLQASVTALQNGDYPLFNKLSQEVARQTGSPIPTNTQMGQTIVGDEIAKAVLGANSAQADREAFAKNLNLGSSNSQAMGQLDEAGKYMAGQAYALENRYKAGTGLDNYRTRFQSPAARSLMERYYPSDSGQQPSPTGGNGQPAAIPVAPTDPKQRVAGQTYINPNGVQGKWTGTGWQTVTGAP